MRFWERPDFIALQRQWYAHAQASGFDDAEELIGTEPRLKQTSCLTRNAEMVDQREEYYALLSQKVRGADFSRDVDRIIMEMRADGAKITHICDELRRQGVCRDRRTVRLRIRVYEVQWGLRSYTPKQLGPYLRTIMRQTG